MYAKAAKCRWPNTPEQICHYDQQIVRQYFDDVPDCFFVHIVA